MRFRWADCELDSGTRSLTRRGEIIGVEPLVFDLLSILLRHRGRVVANRVLSEELGAAVLIDVFAVHPGWPASGVTPIPVASTPTWASLVRFEITASDGSQASWPVTLLPASPTSLTLDGSSFGTLHGFVAPADSSPIAAGAYSMRAVLDASAASSCSYQGIARSQPLSIIVSDPIAQPTPADDETLSLLDARYRLLTGDTTQARSGLEALLTRVPDSIGALEMLSDLDRAAGLNSDALAMID